MPTFFIVDQMMRSKPKNIPRIIKINEIKDFKVYCAFNNGEHRIIDFEKIFEKWEVNEDSFEYLITKPEIFKTVQLVARPANISGYISIFAIKSHVQ